jgi:membrane protease YdiL (CAAX protease family)
VRLRRSTVEAAGALAFAYGAFAHTFRGERSSFWQRMTAAGTVLGSFSLLADPALRRTRIRARDVVLGLASAAGLYAIFQVGDRAARRLLPEGGADIDRMYALRSLRPAPEIAARLGLVIGPAEELFWRGFVLGRLERDLGRLPAAAASAAAYGGAHVASGNLTLVGAASVAGAYWSTLAALGMPMGALIVSHVVWDIWIFLLAPTGPVPAA